jgi:hypothetical protein
MSLIKIVSGGQSGVDRGALDAALAAGLFGISCLTPRSARGRPFGRSSTLRVVVACGDLPQGCGNGRSPEGESESRL